MTQYPFGVVIGRFQIAELHAGHRRLLGQALERCQRLLVLVGSAGAAFTVRNPLPIGIRVSMLGAFFKQFMNIEAAECTVVNTIVTIDTLRDAQSDEAWTEQVDEIIKLHFGAEARAALFHSRDSFASHYLSKRHQLVEIPEIPGISGTKDRRDILHTHQTSSEFRRGIIYATLAREKI